MKKLHNNRGETLIEVLASILIGSLSVALMFGCIIVATDMDEDAKTLDLQHYVDLSTADAQNADPMPVPVKVTIERVSLLLEEETAPSMQLDMKIYGGEGMNSYSRDDSTGGN